MGLLVVSKFIRSFKYNTEEQKESYSVLSVYIKFSVVLFQRIFVKKKCMLEDM